MKGTLASSVADCLGIQDIDGGEACELLQDHDQRSYCMGDCALIPNDPDFRYFCEGACNLIN